MSLLNIISFVLAVVAYTISQLAIHAKLQHWSKEARGYWGFLSHTRKYKKGTKEPSFFLSTTLLVFLTDGYHFMQFLFKLFLILTLVTYEPIFNAWLSDFIIYFGLWQVTFTITYKLLSK